VPGFSPALRRARCCPPQTHPTVGSENFSNADRPSQSLRYCFDNNSLLRYRERDADICTLRLRNSLIFKPKSTNLPRRAGWPDLVLRVGIALVLGYFLGHYLLPRYLTHPELTDHQKWLARPKLGPKPSNGLARSSSHSLPERRSSGNQFARRALDSPGIQRVGADCESGKRLWPICRLCLRFNKPPSDGALFQRANRYIHIQSAKSRF
jgi:hypothetical protein